MLGTDESEAWVIRMNYSMKQSGLVAARKPSDLKRVLISRSSTGVRLAPNRYQFVFKKREGHLISSAVNDNISFSLSAVAEHDAVLLQSSDAWHKGLSLDVFLPRT